MLPMDLVTIRNRLTKLSVTLAVLGVASGVEAQETTEQFIPVGQSPGMSGRYTYLGEIQTVDQQARSITVSDSAGTRMIISTETTRIWLDRSRLRQSNTVGAFSDLQPGRTIEIKYVDYERKENADWIKIRVDASP